jgi:hypothetical protein
MKKNMENDPMSNIDKKKLKYTKNHLPLLQNVNKNKNKTTSIIMNVDYFYVNFFLMIE